LHPAGEDANARQDASDGLAKAETNQPYGGKSSSPAHTALNGNTQKENAKAGNIADAASMPAGTQTSSGTDAKNNASQHTAYVASPTAATSQSKAQESKATQAGTVKDNGESINKQGLCNRICQSRD
jgi:hypothetical protein